MKPKQSATVLCLWGWILPSLLVSATCDAAELNEQVGSSIRLIADNVVQFDITIGGDASEEVQGTAATLADYLQRITGNEVNVQTGDGTQGIAVGVASDFPLLGLENQFESTNPFRRSEYLLRTHSDGLQVIGASPTAVEFAIWDLLFHLGHRQFQPGKNWDIVPQVANFDLAVNDLKIPDYECRGIFYQGGWLPSRNPEISQFFIRNRLQKEGVISVGHAWTGIITDYKTKHGLSDIPREFYHDESWNLLNLDNPAVIQMIADYVIEQFETDPSTFVVGIDPDDGYRGSNKMQAEFKAGNHSVITDYVVNMANQVMQKVRAHFNDGRQRHVGMLAYYYHAPPPSIDVDPDVIIQPAQAMFQGPYTFEEIVTGWREKAPNNRLLTYAYGGYYTGRRSLPNGIPHPRDKAHRIAELDRKFDFSTYLIDTGLSPGDNLVHYIMAHTLWDTDTVERVDELLDDFYARSFGEVQVPMRRFYELFLPDSNIPYGRARVGAMYQALDEAYQGATDPGVRGRIEDLIKHTRYVEMWLDFQDFVATKPTKSVGQYGEVDAEPEILLELQQATTDLMKFIYRTRDNYMVSLRMAMIAANYKFWGQTPDPAADSLPSSTNATSHPWCDDTPFTEADFQRYLSEGIANNR
ncbi:MAG: DUF4838 domain-containing protein [Pirellulaceae bacterium]|nr:DUF4838 domain-containing protein [Pirellulaceae bacterium]